MSSKRMVIVGGSALSFGAAFANTGLVLTTGTSVSHLTGDIAKLTISIPQWNSHLAPDVVGVASAAICFLFGATASGFFIHHPTLNVSRPYGRTIFVIGLLFLIASCVLSQYPTIEIAIAAFACGLQNSLANRYRGVVLRTTHLTGMFTDLGINLGMRIRGHAVPLWKIAVPFLLILSFFCGGILGALVHFHGNNPLQLVGFAYVIGGIAWSMNKHFLTNHNFSKNA